MLQTIILLYGLFYKYRPAQKVQPTSQRKVVVADRPIDIQQKKELGQEDQNIAKASWYDRSACGSRIYGKTCKTANGEIFDETAFTMACDNQFLLGTKFRLTYGDDTIEVVCNDRGNFAKYGRLFDLSRFAFSSLADLSKGVIDINYAKL